MVSINRNLGNLNLQKTNLVKVNTGATLKTPVKGGNVQAKPASADYTYGSWEEYTKNKPKNPKYGQIVMIGDVKLAYGRDGQLFDPSANLDASSCTLRYYSK